MTTASMIHIPLTSAFLCQDCSCVGNSPRRCPACASEVLMALAPILNRVVPDRLLVIDSTSGMRFAGGNVEVEWVRR